MLLRVTQRVTYLGFYLWLLVIVREIERLRSMATKAGTPNSRDIEMNLENVGETSTLLESKKNKEWINGLVEAYQDALAGKL